jgi:hypothetical protein
LGAEWKPLVVAAVLVLGGEEEEVGVVPPFLPHRAAWAGGAGR